MLPQVEICSVAELCILSPNLERGHKAGGMREGGTVLTVWRPSVCLDPGQSVHGGEREDGPGQVQGQAGGMRTRKRESEGEFLVSLTRLFWGPIRSRDQAGSSY